MTRKNRQRLLSIGWVVVAFSCIQDRHITRNDPPVVAAEPPSAVRLVDELARMVCKMILPTHPVHVSIYDPPDFAVVKKEVVALAATTTAFVRTNEFTVQGYEEYSTNEDVFLTHCRRWARGCGPNLLEVLAAVGKYPSGGELVLGSGVLVRPNVVATVKHVADRFLSDIGNAGVLFGFDASQDNWDPHIRDIARICVMHDPRYTRGFGDYALIKISPHKADPVPEIADASKIDTNRARIVAFGHPWGAARLMTGNNDHTYMQYCADEYMWRANLDSLEVSSGSPIYLLGDDRPPRLFGLLRDAPRNVFFCSDQTCDVGKISDPAEPCDVDAPHLLPLSAISERINEFSILEDTEEMDGWKCYSPRKDGWSFDWPDFSINPWPQLCE